MLSKADITAIANDIVVRVRALPERGAQNVRAVRRTFSARLKHEAARDVLAVALALRDTPLRWVGYEIVRHHRAALSSLTLRDVEALGEGFSSWDQVDTFGIYIAGRAWLNEQISDAAVTRWAKRADLWWRRAALVATVVLNSKSHGGKSDARRTLLIARLLVDDREDMVVKALSWALRALAPWDPNVVRRFMQDNDARLAARVKREVRTKLETGRKNRPRS